MRTLRFLVLSTLFLCSNCLAGGMGKILPHAAQRGDKKILPNCREEG
jgi:hypothetical protein